MSLATKAGAFAHAVAAYGLLRVAIKEAYDAELVASRGGEIHRGLTARMRDLRRLIELREQLEAALRESVSHQMEFSFDDVEERELLISCLRDLERRSERSSGSALRFWRGVQVTRREGGGEEGREETESPRRGQVEEGDENEDAQEGSLHGASAQRPIRE